MLCDDVSVMEKSLSSIQQNMRSTVEMTVRSTGVIVLGTVMPAVSIKGIHP